MELSQYIRLIRINQGLAIQELRHFLTFIKNIIDCDCSSPSDALSSIDIFLSLYMVGCANRRK